jgi:hypothetical protein
VTAAPGDLGTGLPPAPLATATSESRRGCNARCPRCTQPFDCGVADAGPCGCCQAALTDAHRRAIAARYSGCLCLACLEAIVAGAHP